MFLLWYYCAVDDHNRYSCLTPLRSGPKVPEKLKLFLNYLGPKWYKPLFSPFFQSRGCNEKRFDGTGYCTVRLHTHHARVTGDRIAALRCLWYVHFLPVSIWLWKGAGSQVGLRFLMAEDSSE